MSDQEVKWYRQLKGSILPYTFDFSEYVSVNALTLNAVTSESSNTNAITIADESTASNVWSGNLTAVNKGCSEITLTVTFTGSNVKRVRKFVVEVTDPGC